MKKIKTITLCSSASFYKDILKIEKELKDLGFKVKIPLTARKMDKSGNFKVESYKTWFKNPKDYNRKNFLMKNHFKKIINSDAILVINNKKKGINGYVGANGLMEMGLAFHYKKPIYLLNKIEDDFWFTEEILGMFPTFLNGKIENIII